jgi:tRNA A37 threonylcarbamoyladenosine dehydratase
MPDRFERSILLYGEDAIQRFSECRVAVIGIGGVGSYAAEALARSGFGYLRLVDSDMVELSNCNRQLWALESTVGEYKVSVAAERLKDINPAVTIDAHPERFCSDTAEKLLAGPLDFVVDAIDSVPDKIELIRRCIANGIPVVSCMGAARRKDPTLIRYGNLFEPTGCPLARKMRRELRKQGIEGRVPVVYSEESAVPVDPGSALPSCCAVPAAVGMAAAAYVCNMVDG